MIRRRRQARCPSGHPLEVADTHTRRLHNVTTPEDPAYPVQEVRIEHGGVYVLSHLPRLGAEIYVGANLRSLHRAVEQVRMLLPDRYRSRVTAALVLPTNPAHTGRLDVAARIGGVLVLDAASLAYAVRCAAPALSTSELSVVEGLLRRQLSPVSSHTTGKRRGWRHLPRPRSTRIHVLDAA